MGNPQEAAEEGYHPKDAIKSATNSAAIGAGTGFLVSAFQNSLAKGNVGAGGVFTRTGSTIATLTLVPATFSFITDATANIREKDDLLNTTIGAFFGGAAIGLRTARMPQILGWGAAASIILTTFEYTGGSLRGSAWDPTNASEFDNKEYMRLNRRRPIAETISNIGEGRGIKPEGYEERRRQRLKEKYGIDINPVKATATSD